jgi:hypothetical protein
MSKFLVFNLQLLPLDSSKTKEVGADGYIRLFEELNKSVVLGFKEKSLMPATLKRWLRSGTG